MKNLIRSSGKFVLAGALLALLFHWYSVELREVASRPKNWLFFAIAIVLHVVALTATFVRWYLLVRVQRLPFRLRDALRMGFVGDLFDFVMPGMVGGDLVKLVMIGREQKRRTVAIATMVVDRMVGLLGILWLGVIASLVFWEQAHATSKLSDLSYLLTVVTLSGTGAFVLCFSPWGRFLQPITKWPGVGSVLTELLEAAALYRKKFHIVLLTLVMSIASHAGFVLAFHLIAEGFEGWNPSVEQHFVIGPIAMTSGALVPVPGGTGSTEMAFTALYSWIAPTSIAAGEHGLVAALGHRMAMLLVATTGGLICIFRWSALTDALAHARKSATPDTPAWSASKA